MRLRLHDISLFVCENWVGQAEFPYSLIPRVNKIGEMKCLMYEHNFGYFPNARHAVQEIPPDLATMYELCHTGNVLQPPYLEPFKDRRYNVPVKGTLILTITVHCSTDRNAASIAVPDEYGKRVDSERKMEQVYRLDTPLNMVDEPVKITEEVRLYRCLVCPAKFACHRHP